MKYMMDFKIEKPGCAEKEDLKTYYSEDQRVVLYLRMSNLLTSSPSTYLGASTYL